MGRHFIAVGVVMAASALAQPVEYLTHGDLETLAEDGRLVEVRYDGRGAMSVVDNAHGGTHAVRMDPAGASDFDPGTNQGEYNALSFGGWYAHGQAVPINPKAIYRWSVWAKGKGRIRLNVTQCSTVFLCSWFGAAFELTDDWQRFEVVYRPKDDNRIWQGTPVVQMVGHGHATVDDVSFRFLPEDNPGIEMTAPTVPTLEANLRVRTRAATVTVFANGGAVPMTGDTAALTLVEGLNVIGVRAEAAGDRPGVAVELPAHPQTRERWRVTTAGSDDWLTPTFDDRDWALGRADADGFVWGAAGEQTVHFRQVIIWNATHYGSTHCLAPKVETWGFPRNSTEVFILAVFSPVERELDGEFEFVFELPRGFRLLDKMSYEPRWIMNLRPECLETEVVRRSEGAFTRYTMHFRDRNLAYPQVCRSELAVVLDGEPETEDLRFYYRRSLEGNVTELENHIPVRLLPPIRGRMPEKIMISLYGSMPPYCSTPQREALAATGTRAGMNVFSLHPNPGWGERHIEQERVWLETVRRHGGRFSMWLTVPLPIPTIRKGHLKWYPQWLAAHPEAQDRYYQGTPAWGTSPHHSSGYCPAYVLSAASAEFWEVIEREADRFLEMYPDPSLVWFDYEHPVLSQDGKGSGGFTARNKEAFRQWAKTAADAELSDEIILAEYRGRWEAFRHWQDGRILARLRQFWNRKGLPMMFYSQGGNPVWDYLKDCLDIPFPGCPGDAPADRYYQPLLDQAASRYRDDLGAPRAVGQRFSSHFMRTWVPGTGFSKPLSHTRFTEPRTWKAQILRIVATFGGGVDLTNVQTWGGGCLYYIGEATRLIATYEDIFYDGRRADELASSADIAYPDLLVLRNGNERLVLLFNENDEPRSVALRNVDLPAGTVAHIYESDIGSDDPSAIAVTIPPHDVAAVHLRMPAL